MALKLCCDGCDCDLEVDKAHQVGWIEPVFYCEDCKGTYDAFVAEEKEKRLQGVREFAVWREARLKELCDPCCPEKGKLKKLPDA